MPSNGIWHLPQRRMLRAYIEADISNEISSKTALAASRRRVHGQTRAPILDRSSPRTRSTHFQFSNGSRLSISFDGASRSFPFSQFFFFLFVLRFSTFLLLIAAIFCFSLLRTGRATNLDCRVVQLAAKRGRCRGRAVSFYLLFNQQNERNSFVNTSCTVYVHCRVFSPAYWLSSPRFS